MAKHHPRGWRSNALPFPHEWFRMAPSPPRLVARLAHNCFPLLPAGRRGTRFCHRSWSADASVEREQNHVPGGGVGRKSAAQAGPGGNALLCGSRTSPGFTQGKGSEAARRPGEEEETLAMEKGEQKVANGAQPGPRAAGCRRPVGPGAPVRRVRAGPQTSPAAPTWRLPGLERAAGSSPTSPPRPLPCPGKGFGERRTGRRCARGRRPSSGLQTCPLRGCRSGAVRGERVWRCLTPGARRGRTGEGRTDWARATGAAQSIPGGRGAGAMRTPRGCC